MLLCSLLLGELADAYSHWTLAIPMCTIFHWFLVILLWQFPVSLPSAPMASSPAQLASWLWFSANFGPQVPQRGISYLPSLPVGSCPLVSAFLTLAELLAFCSFEPRFPAHQPQLQPGVMHWPSLLWRRGQISLLQSSRLIFGEGFLLFKFSLDTFHEPKGSLQRAVLLLWGLIYP